ncbi:hypothetical protein [Siminovitchia fordii]|uniref:Uncharacterized protein n=1 Tax=Siminovitchia fordii TaxID=254759 RepID=A0ABQ4KC67_9BACI|nr:hypothetical protein [Siminovitchia fordii]GIN22626.1 hypothetical protein J1TS3_37600 [Siminovitchia fordii]
MNYQKEQIEMIYMSLLYTLRDQGIEFHEKHNELSDELIERHEAVHLLDLLDGMHDFIKNT